MATIYPVAYLRDSFVDFENANLSIASSPVLYGLSTYTVLPLFKDQSNGQLSFFRFSDHFIRLIDSAKILNFNDFLNSWDEARLLNISRELIKKNKIDGDALLRISVFVDGILSGPKMDGIPHQLAMFAYKAEPILPIAGASLMVSSWRRTPDNSIPARAKVNGSYINASLMKNEALSSGYDDAIALDDQGHVTESTVSNLFIVKSGQLITPSSNADLLEGITRDSIMKMASDLGIEVKDRSIDRSELYIADEAFLSGSTASITPVIKIDGRTIGNGKPGPITAKLSDSYEKIAHGQIKDTHHWLTKV